LDSFGSSRTWNIRTGFFNGLRVDPGGNDISMAGEGCTVASEDLTSQSQDLQPEHRVLFDPTLEVGLEHADADFSPVRLNSVGVPEGAVAARNTEAQTLAANVYVELGVSDVDYLRSSDQALTHTQY
jgi:hypothetical protein